MSLDDMTKKEVTGLLDQFEELYTMLPDEEDGESEHRDGGAAVPLDFGPRPMLPFGGVAMELPTQV